jgi:hypothetical protein
MTSSIKSSLGIISYVQQGTRFYGRILETTTIFDLKHERNFVSSLDWIDFLQTKYPSTNPLETKITKTAHEFYKNKKIYC